MNKAILFHQTEVGKAFIHLAARFSIAAFVMKIVQSSYKKVRFII
jgi:hypothetical protein